MTYGLNNDGYTLSSLTNEEAMAIHTLTLLRSQSRLDTAVELKIPYRTLTYRLRRYREIGLSVPEAKWGRPEKYE